MDTLPGAVPPHHNYATKREPTEKRWKIVLNNFPLNLFGNLKEEKPTDLQGCLYD